MKLISKFLSKYNYRCGLFVVESAVLLAWFVVCRRLSPFVVCRRSSQFQICRCATFTLTLCVSSVASCYSLQVSSATLLSKYIFYSLYLYLALLHHRGVCCCVCADRFVPSLMFSHLSLKIILKGGAQAKQATNNHIKQQ